MPIFPVLYSIPSIILSLVTSLQGESPPKIEYNIIQNNKLNRLMYYMLLSGNDKEFHLKDITYIFSSNMNEEEILRVIESDHQERFCVRTGEEGKTTVRLNANVKVGGEDTLSYVIRVAEAWKAEIYKHLQRVTSSALSVICTELPRPPILPKDLKMRDLLMSDNEQRFCVYGSGMYHYTTPIHTIPRMH